MPTGRGAEGGEREQKKKKIIWDNSHVCLCRANSDLCVGKPGAGRAASQ